VTHVEAIRESLQDVIERFDHVSIAVRNIDDAQTLVNLLGASHLDGGLSPAGDFRWVQFDLPGSGRLELISPAVDDDNHFLNRYLNEHGEGLHHLTFKVPSLEDAVARANELGFTVVGIDDSDPAWKEAFLHPQSANGVLIQLAEFTDK